MSGRNIPAYIPSTPGFGVRPVISLSSHKKKTAGNTVWNSAGIGVEFHGLTAGKYPPEMIAGKTMAESGKEKAGARRRPDFGMRKRYFFRELSVQRMTGRLFSGRYLEEDDAARESLG